MLYLPGLLPAYNVLVLLIFIIRAEYLNITFTWRSAEVRCGLNGLYVKLIGSIKMALNTVRNSS